ncbi:hypothetical protein KQX54_008880 [Cotesia glomerata]|uniref:Uncharacterized protein n=1 Tax=Cotesia glomerata TaxID=32391 RepID=A0AAV7IVR9_COTGL|nr:hypothetical protein KQX54_008880 [Cotesia glomerata]
MGYYVTVASAMIFFLEITWAITLFVQICFRNDEAYCSRCWSYVLKMTKGWRRALFYLPLSSILAWKPHNLWLSFVAAGLLAALSLLHIISSLLSQRILNRPNNDSMGERLLNARPEIYDRFEEVLFALAGNRTRIARVAGEHSTIEPPVLLKSENSFVSVECPIVVYYNQYL